MASDGRGRWEGALGVAVMVVGMFPWQKSALFNRISILDVERIELDEKIVRQMHCADFCLKLCTSCGAAVL